MSRPPSPTAASPIRGPRRPTTARGPRLGVLGSLLLHGLIVTAMVVAFRHSLPMGEESHMVPVDLVRIAAETNVAAAPPPPAPPQPQPVQPEPMTAPPMPDLAQAEPAPDATQPKFDIQEKPKPDTRQDISRLLDQLTAPEKPSRSKSAQAAQSAGAANAMTSTLVDAFLSQIRQCWSPIPGAPNPADQVVDFDLRLNPDGSVASLRLLAASANPYASAAAQAGSRAIYQCQPYHLPPSRYAEWREINPLRFDPRRMMQQ